MTKLVDDLRFGFRGFPWVFWGLCLAVSVLLGFILIAFAALPARANAAGVFPGDRVYVQDRTTSGLWNVSGPAERLDDYSALDLVFVASCPTSHQCIEVREVDLPDWPITVARTRMFALDGNTHHTVIEVDPGQGARTSYAKRYHTVIHEMGHSVGLNHTTRSTSIMLSYQTSITTPDAGDYKNLRRLYNY